MLTFHAMEMKFGSAAAYHGLLEIERAARISSWTVIELDPETRLANACRAQDAMMQMPSAAMALAA